MTRHLTASSAYTSALFLTLVKQHRLPEPVTEFAFAAPDRKWRFDYAWPKNGHVALEVEGGVFIAGRHSRGAGMMKDMEKYNRAAVLGWSVLRVVPRALCTQETIDMLRLALLVQMTA